MKNIAKCSTMEEAFLLYRVALLNMDRLVFLLTSLKQLNRNALSHCIDVNGLEKRN